MKGRKVILTNKPFTLEELYDFMQEKWDKTTYGDFSAGKPTPASIECYIMLPVTELYCLLIYPRAAGSLFTKQDKVIVTFTLTEQGAINQLKLSRRRHPLGLIAKHKLRKQFKTERKGPVMEAVENCSSHMQDILRQAGYLLQ